MLYLDFLYLVDGLVIYFEISNFGDIRLSLCGLKLVNMPMFIIIRRCEFFILILCWKISLQQQLSDRYYCHFPYIYDEFALMASVTLFNKKDGFLCYFIKNFDAQVRQVGFLSTVNLRKKKRLGLLSDIRKLNVRIFLHYIGL